MDTIPRKSSAVTLFGTYVCIEVVLVAATVTGPTWRDMFGLSEMQLGLCLGAAQVGVLAASLFVGHVTDRHGPLRMLTAALGIFLLALAAVTAARNFAMLFTGLAVAGVCGAAAHNGGVTLLSGIFPRTVRRVMALASALWFGSSVLSAPLIGAWLDLASERGWRTWGPRLPFVIVAGLLVFCLFFIRLRFRWIKGRQPVYGAEHDEVIAASPPHYGREWLWIPFLGLCHGLMLVSLVAWLNPMAQAVFGVDDYLGGMLFGVAALGLATGRFLLAAYHPNWDDWTVLTISGCTGAMLLAVALNAPTYGTTLALVGPGTFAASATAPCLFSLVAATFPRMRSRLYGYMEASIATAGMAGAFFVGLLADHGVPQRLAMHVSPCAAFTLGIGALIWKLSRKTGGTKGGVSTPGS